MQDVVEEHFVGALEGQLVPQTHASWVFPTVHCEKTEATNKNVKIIEMFIKDM